MKNSSTIAIVQARMASTRLPGKVLAAIGNATMLDHIVGRLRRCTHVTRVVVATSNLSQDQAIITHCQDRGYDWFADSHDDVLDRFASAAAQFAAGRIVRITADCPLIDPEIVDRTIAVLKANPELDYACNFFPRRTYPRGLDVEALTRRTLELIRATVSDPRQREHVTPAIYENPARFRIGSIACGQDWSSLRWTVDEPSDLTLIRAIYAAFAGRIGSWREIVSAYDRYPHWRLINSHVNQKAA